jgi:hypothetical protein
MKLKTHSIRYEGSKEILTLETCTIPAETVCEMVHIKEETNTELGHRLLECFNGCNGLNPKVFSDVVRELEHLVKLVGPALDDGVKIPGLATLNLAKRLLTEVKK